MCLKKNCDLQKSHLCPSSALKRLRNFECSNPNPMWSTSKFALQTSNQTQDYLLCWDCEQRLRSNGEDWVMENCWHRNGRFPLQQALEASKPELLTQYARLYRACDIPAIRIDQLSYFAASVFWRASVHNWRTGKFRGNTKGMLGPYEEEFRKYLMGETGFPEHAALWVAVTVSKGLDIAAGVFEPATSRPDPTCKVHKFFLLGISFMLYVGKTIDARYKTFCFVRGWGNCIGIQSILDDAIARMWHARASKNPPAELTV